METGAAGHTDTRAVAEASRLLSDSSEAEALLRYVAIVIVQRGIASAAAVYELLESGRMTLRAANALSVAVPDALEAEIIGKELEETVARATAGAYAETKCVPLVTEQGLYGALVLFDPSQHAREGAADVVLALADVAAAALSRAHRNDLLARAYEELKSSRELLARTERMRLIGQMAAGIVHDLRNILSPLFLQVQLMQRTTDPARLRSDASKMEKVLQRGVALLDRLKGFSRISTESPRVPADLDALVEEAAEITRAKVAETSGRIVLSLGRPPPVRVEPAELVSAVVNLVYNACEAAGQGATVCIATGHDETSAFIRVEDGGPGIPPQIQARMYEPFFTTKGDQGTGLGLPMVLAFVERNGGEIRLDTRPGSTVFTLSFPLEAHKKS